MKKQIRKAGNQRRGTAPLEMAMCLPVMVLMMALLFLVADAGIQRIQIVPVARTRSWQTMSGHQSSNAMRLSGGGQNDIVSGSSSGSVSLGRGLGISPSIHTDLSVMGGPWDHRVFPKGKGLHFEETSLLISQGSKAQFSGAVREVQQKLNTSGGGGGLGFGGKMSPGELLGIIYPQFQDMMKAADLIQGLGE